MCFQYPFKLQKRFFIKRDIVDILRTQFGDCQTVFDGAFREAGVVLDPRKSLFLSRGNDLTIDHQGSCRIMIKSREAEDGGHETRSNPKRKAEF